MKRFLSLMLTLTMLTTLFIGFSLPVSAAVLSETATLTIAPDKTEIAGAEGTAEIIYTIKLTPPTGKAVTAVQFTLDVPEGMTLATKKHPAGTVNQGKTGGYWLNTKGLKYAEDEDTGDITGIFGAYDYEPTTVTFACAGVNREDLAGIAGEEVVLFTIAATVDSAKEAEYTLGATNVVFGAETTGDKYTNSIATTKVVAEGIHVCTLQHVEAKAPSCDEMGNIEYWYCTSCGTHYEDEAKTKETTKDAVHIDATHNYGELNKEVPADCTKDGKKAYYQCSDCKRFFNDKKEEVKETELVIPSTGHSKEKEIIPGKAADCTNPGLTDGEKCKTCGETTKKQEEIPATGHSKEKEIIPGKAATCTEPGLTDGEKCKTCGTVTKAQEEIPATGHDKKAQVEEYIPDDCSKDGMKAHYYCATCEKYFSDADYKVEVQKADLVIPADHLYGELVAEKAATCTENGTKAHYQCSSCKKFFDEAKKEVKEDELVIPASHKLTLVPAKDKTCTEDGNIEYYKCSVEECGKLFEDEKATVETSLEKVTLAAGHEMTKHEAKNATCTAEGNILYYSCSVCKKNFEDAEGKVEVEKITTDKLPHTEKTIPGVAPTCTTSGLTEGKVCTVCKAELVKQVILEKTGHDVVKVDAVAATCEAEGYEAYWKCNLCQTWFKDEDLKEAFVMIEDIMIPALGHTMGDWETVNEPTDSEDGDKKRVCLNECGYEELAKIPMTGTTCGHADWETTGIDEITKEATCTEAGLKNILCSECYEVAQENVEIPALGHMDGEYSAIYSVGERAATCTEAGHEAHYACYLCEALFSDAEGTTVIEAPVAIEATGHDFSGAAVDNVKTCLNGCGATQTVIGGSQEPGDEPAEVVTEEQKLIDSVITEEDEVRVASGNYTVSAKMTVEDVTATATDVIKNKIAEIANVAADAYDTIEKIVLDITINKHLDHESDSDLDMVIPVTEAEELVEFDITIPGSLRGSDKVFHVLRAHDGVVDDITTTPDPVTHEYIVVDKNANLIRFFAKYFSEYAIVAVEETTPAPSPVGGGGSTRYTVKFVTNADKKLASVSIRKNATLSEPAAITKDGYVFDGWYTDAAFTEKYDFTKAVTRSFTLYAKWVEVEGSGDGWNVFADVKEADWFYEAVKYANENGLMNGVAATEFAPNANVTRGMFVTVLYRIEKEPEVNAAAFTDVAAGTWYADAVAWASENGITAGVSETEFAPDNNISREQIATMLYRYANFKKFNVAVGAELSAFADAEAISEYAIDAFKWAVADGIMNGKTATTLNPADNATRAETAALLMRVIEKYNK